MQTSFDREGAQPPSTISTQNRAAGRRTLGIVAVLLAVQAALTFAFVFPGYKPTPHHVPVAFVGPPTVESSLTTKAGASLSFSRYGSESAARAAIDHRQVYGAIIATGAEPRLLVASAASVPVAQLLRETVAGSNTPVQVEDVAPLDHNDPRGATLNLMFLPLISVCFTAVVALGALRLSPSRLLGAIGLFAGLGGFAVTAVIAVGLDAVPGSYLALSAFAALTMLAIALPTAALQRCFGRAGFVLGVLLFLAIGNPASGNATAPQLLPGFWRWIGQLMPPGAGGTGLRNISYFDGTALTRPLLVLAGYAIVGGMLVAVADALRRWRTRTVTQPRVARRHQAEAALAGSSS
jgi:hypothetical protein